MSESERCEHFETLKALQFHLLKELQSGFDTFFEVTRELNELTKISESENSTA